MRILILSQYYKPEPIPKPVELAQELKKRGHDVTVITGFPNYPSGKLYDGFCLRPVTTGFIDGIRVIRTYEYPYHGTRAGGRFLNYFSFMFSSVLGSLFAPKVDAIYVWHPPLTIGVSAWLISLLKRAPFVYDVQDIWPESAILSGILQPGFLVNCIAKLEDFVYKRARHLLVVTEGARQNLISKGVPGEKVSVMAHWFDEQLVDVENRTVFQGVRRRHGWEQRFVVLFAGNMGLVQGLECVLRAAEVMKSDSNILFVFVGDGSDKQRLQQIAGSLGLGANVQFIDRQPIEKMSEYFAASDALLVHLKHSELSNYVIPTKTIAYLAAEKPIIMAMNGAAADLVRAAKAGVVVPPDNAPELAMAIRQLSTLPPAERLTFGKNGRKYLLENLSKEKIIPLYESILTQMVAGESS